MTPESQLAEFVMNHLSRGAPTDVALGSVIRGLADLATAFGDLQERRGNWGSILANLRGGSDRISGSLDVVRAQGPGFLGLVTFAERHLRFAGVIVEEVIRLEARDSTPTTGSGP